MTIIYYLLKMVMFILYYLYSNIMENLWDKDGNFIDDNTLRVNIKRLRQKLRDDNQEYIVTVFGIGYTFGE